MSLLSLITCIFINYAILIFTSYFSIDDYKWAIEQCSSTVMHGLCLSPSWLNAQWLFLIISALYGHIFLVI